MAHLFATPTVEIDNTIFPFSNWNIEYETPVENGELSWLSGSNLYLDGAFSPAWYGWGTLRVGNTYAITLGVNSEHIFGVNANVSKIILNGEPGTVNKIKVIATIIDSFTTEKK
jgi:hypothetical protein